MAGLRLNMCGGARRALVAKMAAAFTAIAPGACLRHGSALLAWVCPSCDAINPDRVLAKATSFK